jgi:preprotein translocase SecE subunit
VAEWSIAAVLKTAKAKHLRGFESLPLRQIENVKKYILGLFMALVAFLAVTAAPGDAAPQAAAPQAAAPQAAAPQAAAPQALGGADPAAATSTAAPGTATTTTAPPAATTPATAPTTPSTTAPKPAKPAKSGWLGLTIWAAVILGVFAFLWSKGYLVKIRNYTAETQEELKKCSWPTREELKGSTVVVLITTALLGLFTVGVDWILSNLMRLIT